MVRVTEVYEDCITHHASEGRLTLQVPNNCIGTPTSATVSVDSSHFVILKSEDGIPAVGRETGFLFFTEAGFEHYKSELEAVFDADIRGNTWAQFEEHAASVFAKRKKKLQKAILNAELKVQQLRSFQKC